MYKSSILTTLVDHELKPRVSLVEYAARRARVRAESPAETATTGAVDCAFDGCESGFILFCCSLMQQLELRDIKINTLGLWEAISHSIEYERRDDDEDDHRGAPIP